MLSLPVLLKVEQAIVQASRQLVEWITTARDDGALRKGRQPYSRFGPFQVVKERGLLTVVDVRDGWVENLTSDGLGNLVGVPEHRPSTQLTTRQRNGQTDVSVVLLADTAHQVGEVDVAWFENAGAGEGLQPASGPDRYKFRHGDLPNTR